MRISNKLYVFVKQFFFGCVLDGTRSINTIIIAMTAISLNEAVASGS